MSFVLLHIAWDRRQPNHLLTCVPGSQSHPAYLKLCLPGPVLYENSWESCHISRVPGERQMKAARKAQPRSQYAMGLLALAGRQERGPGGGWETSGGACGAAAVTAQQLASAGAGLGSGMVPTASPGVGNLSPSSAACAALAPRVRSDVCLGNSCGGLTSYCLISYLFLLPSAEVP